MYFYYFCSDEQIVGPVINDDLIYSLICWRNGYSNFILSKTKQRTDTKANKKPTLIVSPPVCHTLDCCNMAHCARR